MKNNNSKVYYVFKDNSLSLYNVVSNIDLDFTSLDIFTNSKLIASPYREDNSEIPAILIVPSKLNGEGIYFNPMFDSNKATLGAGVEVTSENLQVLKAFFKDTNSTVNWILLNEEYEVIKSFDVLTTQKEKALVLQELSKVITEDSQTDI